MIKTKPTAKPEDKDEHARANARGWSATITALVAALDMDFDRLEELRDEFESLTDNVKQARAEYMEAKEPDEIEGASEACEKAEAALAEFNAGRDGEELRELTELAEYEKGYPFKDADDVNERIQESPLSVQVRSGWYSPGETPEAEQFEIRLSIGGPALRIMGELDEHKQPHRAWLEYQDWGTPWTEYHGEGAASQDDLVRFASCFYFGE